MEWNGMEGSNHMSFHPRFSKLTQDLQDIAGGMRQLSHLGMDHREALETQVVDVLRDYSGIIHTLPVLVKLHEEAMELFNASKEKGSVSANTQCPATSLFTHCHTFFPPLPHLFPSIATPLSLHCHTSFPPLPHLFPSIATPLSLHCHTSFPPLPHLFPSTATPLFLHCHTSFPPLPHLFPSIAAPLSLHCHTSFPPLPHLFTLLFSTEKGGGGGSYAM